MGLLPLVVFELALALCGWQGPSEIEDPYVGFESTSRLFERDGDRFRVADTRKPLFCDDSFLATKPSRGLRLFCVGGSTVQGRPFATETAFSKWLEIRLQQCLPKRTVEVVNCGGVSYASYRLAPIVDEVLAYQPDAIILYTGHNEFLEDRTYESIRQQSSWLTQGHAWLSNLRTYTFLRSCLLGRDATVSKAESSSEAASSSKAENVLSAEVEARLDFQGGLELYHRDDDWRQGVVQHFELNLERMIVACQTADVPLLIVKPVSNLRDASPFKSQHRRGLSAEDRIRFEALLASTDPESNQGRALVAGQVREKLNSNRKALEQAVELDPRFALARYRLGQTLLLLGNVNESRVHLIAAKEEDVCPLRAIEPILAAVEGIADRNGVPMLDAQALFASHSPDGIVGSESLVDHVHPSIAGHQVLADAIAKEFQRQGWFGLTGVDFEDDPLREEIAVANQSHLESLPNLYFELGKDRLAGLKRWAKGEVRKQREQ